MAYDSFRATFVAQHLLHEKNTITKKTCQEKCKTQNKKTAKFLFLYYPADGIDGWIFGINPDECNTDFPIFKLSQTNTLDFQFIESLTCQDFSFFQNENYT